MQCLRHRITDPILIFFRPRSHIRELCYWEIFWISVTSWLDRPLFCKSAERLKTSGPHISGLRDTIYGRKMFNWQLECRPRRHTLHDCWVWKMFIITPTGYHLIFFQCRGSLNLSSQKDPTQLQMNESPFCRLPHITILVQYFPRFLNVDSV